MKLGKMVRGFGMVVSVMLACGCVKTVTGKYYNLKADGLYYSDQKAAAYAAYSQSAQDGVADAQYMVAQMLLYNDGIGGNSAEGLQWLEKAAQQNHVEAIRDLGIYRMNGEFDCPRDPRQGAALLSRAAEGGDSLAMLTLGYLYVSGYGVDRNSETAAYWFGQAARQGEAIPAAWQDAGYLAGAGSFPSFNPKTEYRQRVKRAQSGLKALGYYKSRVDGISGPGTAAAVKRFQQDQRLAVNGRIDLVLMRHLYRRIVFDPIKRQV